MRIRRTAIVAALTLLAAGLSAIPAHAQSDRGLAASTDAASPRLGGVETRDELFVMQQRLVAAADAIRAVVRDDDGLAGISARPERGELWIYWKGQVPDAVRAAIAEQRNAVPIRILPADYSRRELLAAAQVVAVQPGVIAVGPLGDGSGLSVSTDGSLDDLRNLPAVRDAGIPLVPKARRPVLAGRQNSVAPHFGGAAFTFPTSGGTGMCTTGFAVRLVRERVPRLLTAGHCGSDEDTVYTGTGQLMGTVRGDHDPMDIMLIDTNAAGRIWEGSYNSNNHKPVHMAIGTYLDTLVCTSGAMTGEHCNIRITMADLYINVGYIIGPLVEAEHDFGTVAAGRGDSGGPVVAQDSWGPLGHGDFVLVYPMGTITAIDALSMVPCGSSFAPTDCSDTVYYVGIMDALNYYDATIVTG